MRTTVVSRKVWVALLVATLIAAMTVTMVVKAQPAHAAFPGSSGDIAFTSDRQAESKPPGVYRMSADGFKPTLISDFTSSNLSSSLPAWSASGKKIAYTVDTNCSTFHCPQHLEIVWTTAAGSAATPSATQASLAYNPQYANDTEAAWFPSNTKVAFRSDRASGNNDIWVQNLDTSGNPATFPIRLTKKTSFEGEPAVSPDGKKIAFVSDRGGGDYEIYVMKAAPESSTNVPKKLTNNSVDDAWPDWSPSGQQIVFQRGDFNAGDIWRIRADGSGTPVNLTKSPFPERDPSFSPDGMKIAFERETGGNRDIWRMRADGSRQVNLTSDSSAIDANPSWQPIP